jgi:hypothetical protein
MRDPFGAHSYAQHLIPQGITESNEEFRRCLGDS